MGIKGQVALDRLFYILKYIYFVFTKSYIKKFLHWINVFLKLPLYDAAQRLSQNKLKIEKKSVV